MGRNTVLFISTAAVLLLAYFSYTALVQPASPAVDSSIAEVAPTPLPSANRPTATQAAAEDVLEIGTAKIPPGQGISFVVYDRFGQPTDKFKAARWQKAAGKEREITVEKPEIAMLLPSGMTALISADTGQFTADRTQDQKFEPKIGMLSGNTRIVLERSGTIEPAAEKNSSDSLTIDVETLHFNLEAGELKTDGPIHVTSDLFEIDGVGLRLVWSRQANRVETLTIDQGRELVLYVRGGLFGAMNGEGSAEATPVPPQSTTQNPQSKIDAPSSAPTPEQRAARITSYFCTLDGGIVADHEQFGRRRGGLEADEVRMLFDVGGSAERIFEMQRDKDAPRRSARESHERLVVRWNGKLSLTPTTTPEKLDRPRRQLEAIGSLVKLDMGERCIVCGKLTYHDETRRIWLSPIEGGGAINLSLGSQLSAQADSIFFDQRANIVKLVGDVWLRSMRPGRGGEAMSVRCAQWAELRLPASAEDDESSIARDVDADALNVAGKIESAVFVGDVKIEMNGQTLRADRLEARFRPAQGNEPLEALMERAIASGAVRLIAGKESNLPDWLEFFADKLQHPLRAVAGEESVEQSLDCGWLELIFASGVDGRPYARELNATGDVHLRDRRQPINARGKRLAATLGEGNRLVFANIFGSQADPAQLDGDVFSVRGGTIEFDPINETMRVPGAARLRFMAERSFRGQQRRRAEPVVVKCYELLQVDGKGNTIDFRGQVVAETGDEQLQGEALTLFLEDVAPPAVAAKSADWSGVTAQIREQFARTTPKPSGVAAATQPAIAANSQPAGRGFVTGGSMSRGRKEPVRLLARKAIVKSEMFIPSDPQPIVHQSIDAPELDIDIRKRAIHTTGVTTLLMIDRRLPTESESDSTRDAVGLPSALVTRGASQTALQCQQSMTYALGADGPSRRDSVIFEGNVFFRHVAGRDMANLSELFPTLANNPDFLAKLKSRDSLLSCDRLEGTFEVGEESAAAATSAAGSAARTPMRMTWLNAIGSVGLVDKQGPARREVTGQQLEFDRVNQLVRVLGSTSRDARVTYSNSKTQQFDEPAVGPEFLIDLKSNTLKAGRFQGMLQRRYARPELEMLDQNTLKQAHEAFSRDDSVCVRELLDHHPELKARINEPLGNFDSPAITGVRSREMLDVLLAAGADINAKSRWWAGGFGLLHFASPDLAAYAIQRGAAVDIHAAARLGMLDKLRELITNDPELVHARGGDGQMPLHFASTIEVAAFLLDHGAAIDARDVDHESTAAQYMLRERQEVAGYLITRGCMTDLLMAVALGDLDLARKHLDADPDSIRLRVSDEYFPLIGGKTGGTIYQWVLGWYVSAHQVARDFGHEPMFELLMQRSPDEIKLVTACWLHDEAMVKSLLAAQPDLAARLQPAERRQLAHAARNNDLTAVRLMLDAGLPVDATSQHAGTPLHWAAFQGNAEMATLLLHKNPPLEVKDRDFDGTPLNWAIYGSEHGWHCQTSDYAATVAVLLRAGAKPPPEHCGTPAVRQVLATWIKGAA